MDHPNPEPVFRSKFKTTNTQPTAVSAAFPPFASSKPLAAEVYRKPPKSGDTQADNRAFNTFFITKNFRLQENMLAKAAHSLFYVPSQDGLGDPWVSFGCGFAEDPWKVIFCPPQEFYEASRTGALGAREPERPLAVPKPKNHPAPTFLPQTTTHLAKTQGAV